MDVRTWLSEALVDAMQHPPVEEKDGCSLPDALLVLLASACARADHGGNGTFSEEEMLTYATDMPRLVRRLMDLGYLTVPEVLPALGLVFVEAALEGEKS